MGAQRVGWQYFLLALWRAASDDAIYDPSPLSSFIRESRKPQNGTTCQSLWIKRGTQRVNRTDRPTDEDQNSSVLSSQNEFAHQPPPSCLSTLGTAWSFLLILWISAWWAFGLPFFFVWQKPRHASSRKDSPVSWLRTRSAELKSSNGYSRPRNLPFSLLLK